MTYMGLFLYAMWNSSIRNHTAQHVSSELVSTTNPIFHWSSGANVQNLYAVFLHYKFISKKI